MLVSLIFVYLTELAWASLEYYGTGLVDICGYEWV